MILGMLPQLNKEYIFRYIKEEDIFCKYLGFGAIPKDKFCNPLRTDNYPTCELYYANHDNRIRFTDWSGFTFSGKHKGWDCFDLVQYVLNQSGGVEVPYYLTTGEYVTTRINVNINSNDFIQLGNQRTKLKALSFQLVLEDIAKRFKLHRYSDAKTLEELEFVLPNKEIVKPKKASTILQFQMRNWNIYDQYYWNRYYINLSSEKQILKMRYYGIYPVEYGFMNNELVYSYNHKDPCYAYHITRQDNRDIIQFYYPLREKGNIRFITNSNNSIVFGLNRLTPSLFGIITKSYKDIRILNNFRLPTEYNDCIQSIAPPSEGVVINTNVYHYIRYICDYWFTLFDYDFTGIRLSVLYYIEYRISPIYFRFKPMSFDCRRKLIKEFGIALLRKVDYNSIVINTKAKDFSDNLQILGDNKMQRLINYIYNKLNPNNEIKKQYTYYWINQRRI